MLNPEITGMIDVQLYVRVPIPLCNISDEYILNTLTCFIQSDWLSTHAYVYNEV